MTQAILGIDVSKAKFDVALLQDEQLHYQHFANTKAGYAALTTWLHKAQVKELHACLEATGQYGRGVAEHLFIQGFQVSIANPLRVKHYGASLLRRFKSDKGDAELIALFCQAQQPRLWKPLEAQVQELQDLERRLADLKDLRQQERNRLQAGGVSDYVRATIKTVIAFFDTQIKQLEREMHNHIKRHSQLKHQQDLLKSIPGIGALTAAVCLGEIGDFAQFGDAKQLAAWAGLAPEPRDSGSSGHRKTRLCKKGNARLRRALYMPAVVAMKHNPLMRDLAARMTQTGHRKMEIVGAIMRKLLHLVYGIIKTDKLFDPNHAQRIAA